MGEREGQGTAFESLASRSALFVFRHDDIADDDEAVALASLFQNREELVPAPSRTKKRQTAVAGGSDKVQVMSAVGPMQAAGHNKLMIQAASYPPLQRTQGRGTQSSGTGKVKKRVGRAGHPRGALRHGLSRALPGQHQDQGQKQRAGGGLAHLWRVARLSDNVRVRLSTQRVPRPCVLCKGGL